MKYFLVLLIVLKLSYCTGSVKEIAGEDCRQISGMPGPEDFVIDREDGVMYVSSHERRIEGKFGSIFLVDLKAKEKTAKKLEINYPANFRPHGLSMAKLKDGKRLFVLSHLDDYFGESHAIEVFKIEKNNLVHEKTITNEHIVSPNDLYVHSDGRIFVSNDHGKGGTIQKFFQDAFATDSSSIAYFDGKEWHDLDQKIAFGNGIHFLVQDGKEFVYRASSLDKKVTKYELRTEKEKPYLVFQKDFPLNSMMDNFELDDEGNLLVAGHFSTIQFLRNKSSKENLSAVQVFQIDKADNSKEIFANSGKLISSASVAAIYKGRIYIGQVFEPFVLDCKSPY